jgi:hypothetical protein
VAALPLEKALMPELWFSLLAYGVNVADRNLQIWESNLGHRVRWDIASVLYVPIVLIKFIFYPNMGNRQTLTNFFLNATMGTYKKTAMSHLKIWRWRVAYAQTISKIGCQETDRDIENLHQT